MPVTSWRLRSRSRGDCWMVTIGTAIVLSGHRLAGREPQYLAIVLDQQAGALDQPVCRAALRHLDFDQLAAHLDAHAQAVPVGGQPRAEADAAVEVARAAEA